MQPFSNLSSTVCPIPIKDIDTDMIIPAQFLTSISRDGFGQHLFTRLKATDPSFPLNIPRYQGAEILLADSNFGCGSSREHAVWAIHGAGFKAVIAKSFADIFSSNSGKNGLLLIRLPEEVVNYLLAKASAHELRLKIDLEAQEVTELDAGKAQNVWHFKYDPFLKHCLINGLDELDYLLSQNAEILARKTQLQENFYFNALQPNRETTAISEEVSL